MKKAQSVSSIFNDKYIIGCDQILECEGKLINKAQNLDEAKENLAYLTGKNISFSHVYMYLKTQKNFL